MEPTGGKRRCWRTRARRCVYREYPLPHAVDPGFLAELGALDPGCPRSAGNGGLTKGERHGGDGLVGVLRGGGRRASRHAARALLRAIRRGARRRAVRGRPRLWHRPRHRRAPETRLDRAGDRRGRPRRSIAFGDARTCLPTRSDRLRAVRSSFQEAAWPDADLVNSSFALPFCPPEGLPRALAADRALAPRRGQIQRASLRRPRRLVRRGRDDVSDARAG